MRSQLHFAVKIYFPNIPDDIHINHAVSQLELIQKIAQ